MELLEVLDNIKGNEVSEYEALSKVEELLHKLRYSANEITFSEDDESWTYTAEQIKIAHSIVYGLANNKWTSK